MTQNEKVLAYLRENGSISPLEAMEALGIMRLGARIYDLKEQGADIETRRETKKNRYGVPVTYARYVLRI